MLFHRRWMPPRRRTRYGAPSAAMKARRPRSRTGGVLVGLGEGLARLAAVVVEVGAGHGLNFAHYPPEVTRVIALEPNSALRDQAAAAAGSG